MVRFDARIGTLRIAYKKWLASLDRDGVMSVDHDVTREPSGSMLDGPTGQAPHPQTVARYIVTAVPIGRHDESVGDVRQRLIGRKYDDASHVFVVTETGKLSGIVGIDRILDSPAATPLGGLIENVSANVMALTTDREEAASVAIRAGVSILGVCDSEGRFVGAVPASALMSILRDEHLEDLHHMAGILGKSEAAKAALLSPPYRRALYRMPWLLVGMAGSAVATAMMARFETALAANIAVALFIPAIVYLADAIGTQSEAVVVRGLSLTATDLAPLLVGELGTGILIGGALGAIALPLVWLGFGSGLLAATVAITLLAASAVATTIGFLLPWLFARFGYDPAFGAGPMATVIQDVLSLLIYFTIAAALVF